MRTQQENDLQPREQPEQPLERLDAGTEFGDAWGTVHVPGVGVPRQQCQVDVDTGRASSSQTRSAVGSLFSAQMNPVPSRSGSATAGPGSRRTSST